MDAFRKFVRVYALIISLLIAPPIFERFFAMLYLFQGERVILWIASLLLMSPLWFLWPFTPDLGLLGIV